MTDKILIIDDEQRFRELLARIIGLEGFTVFQAKNVHEGFKILEHESINVVVTDVKLPDGNGLQVLERIKQKYPLIEVIVITAFGTIQDGVNAMKQGAFDYITKGDEDDHIHVVVERAVEKARLHSKLKHLEQRVGHKYSFENITGAAESKRGLLDEADGGTLFLDEIGEMDIHLQAKMLRFLENKTFTRLGDTNEKVINTRIIAATNKDLKEQAERETFRADLYYRLAGFEIDIPPLRERIEDIPLLVSFFLKRTGRDVDQVDDEAVKLLKAYPWKGNIRELKNIIERAVILAEGDRITADLLPPEFHQQSSSSTGLSSTNSLEEMERWHIQRVLEQAEGNKTKAAKILGIGASTLYRKIDEYNL